MSSDLDGGSLIYWQICLSPGCTIPAAWCYTDGFSVHQKEHEEERHDWLVCSWLEQFWWGGARPLEPNERLKGWTSLSLACPSWVLGNLWNIVMFSKGLVYVLFIIQSRGLWCFSCYLLAAIICGLCGGEIECFFVRVWLHCLESLLHLWLCGLHVFVSGSCWHLQVVLSDGLHSVIFPYCSDAPFLFLCLFGLSVVSVVSGIYCEIWMVGKVKSLWCCWYHCSVVFGMVLLC